MADALDDLLTLHVGNDGRTRWLLLDNVDADVSPLGLAVRALPGKGFGVVATRQIARGARIIAEQPLILWHSTRDSSGNHDWNELDSLVCALSDADRRAFFGLCDKHSSHSQHARTAHGIWNSNSFPTEDVMGGGLAGDGIVRSAVYRLCSRINHECVPNCFAAWSAALGQQTVHALRDIVAGEEISIAYVGGAEAGPRALRQRLLRDKYHFECVCGACALRGAALTASEERQHRMHQLHGQLSATTTPAAAASGSSSGTTKSTTPTLECLVGELHTLLREEGLPLVWGRTGLILLVVQLKQTLRLREAAKWAAEGAAAARLALGEDSSMCRKLDGLRQAFAAAVGDDVAEGCDGAPPSSGAADEAATAAAAAEAAEAAEDDDEEEAPRTATYDVGDGHATFDRGAEGAACGEWDAEASGRRVLHLTLMSHRRRWAQRLWPAGQVLARRLDAAPSLVGGRAVLEIGAGAALPSVVAGALGASALVVTDYPDDLMLANMRSNLDANLTSAQRSRTRVVGYDWNAPPSALLDTLATVRATTPPTGDAAGTGDGRFDLILLADLLYECEHEPILHAVAACLARRENGGGGSDDDPRAPYPRALLTFQVHDRCQLGRQTAFFDLAPGFGLAVRKLDSVTVGRQFDDDDGEDDEEEGCDEAEDVTAQVQLFELTHA